MNFYRLKQVIGILQPMQPLAAMIALFCATVWDGTVNHGEHLLAAVSIARHMARVVGLV
jgi:hypothetical protein